MKVFERKGLQYFESINQSLENYLICNYQGKFTLPQVTSDEELYNKMKILDWITPDYLNIRPSNVNEYCWDSIIQEIKAFDCEKVPSLKLKNIQNAFSMIKSSIKIFGKREDPGSVEDISLILFYCILKATPQYFISDIK